MRLASSGESPSRVASSWMMQGPPALARQTVKAHRSSSPMASRTARSSAERLDPATMARSPFLNCVRGSRKGSCGGVGSVMIADMRGAGGYCDSVATATVLGALSRFSDTALKAPPRRADSRTYMRLWFRTIATFLRSQAGDDTSIEGILRDAVRRSASIGIGSLDGVALPSPLAGHVVALEPDALVISRPFEGPVRKELVSGESIELSISAERGFHHGVVEVIGRWTSSDGGERRYGYRVTLPRSLLHEERRGLHRIPVAFDLAPRASLLRAVTLTDLGDGTVLDVSEGGLCIRASLRGLVRPDEAVIVKAEFPSILPPIHTRMTVAHVLDSRQAGMTDLGLRFAEPQPALGHAIRALELRRINRAGAA